MLASDLIEALTLLKIRFGDCPIIVYGGLEGMDEEFTTTVEFKPAENIKGYPERQVNRFHVM